MKISQSRLKRIIKEEVRRALTPVLPGDLLGMKDLPAATAAQVAAYKKKREGPKPSPGLLQPPDDVRAYLQIDLKPDLTDWEREDGIKWTIETWGCKLPPGAEDCKKSRTWKPRGKYKVEPSVANIKSKAAAYFETYRPWVQRVRLGARHRFFAAAMRVPSVANIEGAIDQLMKPGVVGAGREMAARARG